MAKIIKWAIDGNITGLYHVTNNLSINKYKLLKLFQKYTEKEISISPVEGKGVDKSFVDTRLLIDYDIPDYENMIKEMVVNIKSSNMYSYKV